MDITTSSPAQIDAEIARIESLRGAEYAKLDAAHAALKRSYVSDERKAQINETFELVKSALDALRVEIAPLDGEFTRRGGWARYYLVEGGHLHYDVSSYRCSRIQTTSHYWMTDLSGMSADEAIELAGERVCTVCFPQAPVAVQERPSQLLTKSEAEKAQDRQEREDKRTATANKKDAAKIFAADGGPLRSGFDVVKTEREALSAYMDAILSIALREDDAETELNRAKGQSFEDLKADHERVLNDFYRPYVEGLLAALAAKRGVEVEALRAELAKKLPAKVRAAKKEGALFRARNSHFYANA